MNKPMSINNWNMGGLSESRVLGTEHSLWKMVGVNVHDEVGLLKNNKRMEDISGTTVDEFCEVMLTHSNGNVYAFSSESGNIWQYTSEGTWTNPVEITSTNGESKILGACEYNGYLYFATQNYLYKIQNEDLDETDWSSYVEEVGNMSVDPVIGDNLYSGGTAEEYTLPTSISETATALTSYTPSNTYLSGVSIYIDTVPSTSITVTVHTAANVVLATKTVAAASLTTGVNDIFFDTVATYTRGDTYHVHVIQTGTGGKINTATADDQSDMYLSLYGSCDTDYHPMIVQNNVLFVGDRYYVHQVENTLTLWALDIPREQHIKCLGKMDIDLLIGTEVDADVHRAMIFRWNTWSESWTIEDEIPERSINAFIPVDNYMYIIAGNRGNVYYYNGQVLELWRRVGGEFLNADTIAVYPNAVTSFNGIPMIGISNLVGDPIEQGIYSMGTVNARQFPRIFCLDYVPSEGMEGMDIGALCAMGNDVFMSWKHGTDVGIDKTHSRNLYSGAYIQSRVFYRDRNVRSTYRKAVVNYHKILENTYEEPTGLGGTLAGYTGGQNYWAGFPTSVEGASVVTFDNATNIVELDNHGLMEDEEVVFTTDGSLPAELEEYAVYYVFYATEITEDSFQLRDNEGNLVTFTDDGIGTHNVHLNKLIKLYYRKDYNEGWTELNMTHDGDKHQFISESWGDWAFCMELKLELRAWAGMTSVIDEITLYTE
jgi:hypothetical protein